MLTVRHLQKSSINKNGIHALRRIFWVKYSYLAIIEMLLNKMTILCFIFLRWKIRLIEKGELHTTTHKEHTTSYLLTMKMMKVNISICEWCKNKYDIWIKLYSHPFNITELVTYFSCIIQTEERRKEDSTIILKPHMVHQSTTLMMKFQVNYDEKNTEIKQYSNIQFI